MKLHSFALYALLMGMGLGTVSTPAQAMFNNGLLRAQSTGKNVVSALKTGILSPINHPYITTTAGLAAAGLGGLYLVHCNKNAKDWTSVIEESQLITRFMINSIGMPDKLMYWQNKPKDSGHWPTAADIISNSTEVYNTLKKAKWADDKSEHDFIIRMKCIVEKEKKELMKVFAKLENCLAESNVLPSFGGNEQPAGESNIVQEMIQKKMINLNYEPNTDFTSLTKKEAESLNRDISKRAMPSFWNVNPYLMVRGFALPFETRAIREYWRMYQLLYRLEALKICLDQQLLNTQASAQNIILEAR